MHSEDANCSTVSQRLAVWSLAVKPLVNAAPYSGVQQTEWQTNFAVPLNSVTAFFETAST